MELVEPNLVVPGISRILQKEQNKSKRKVWEEEEWVVDVTLFVTKPKTRS